MTNLHRHLVVSGFRILFEARAGELPFLSGQMMSTDSNAVMAGVRSAPHQEIVAKTAALQISCNVPVDPAEVTRKARFHMTRKERSKTLLTGRHKCFR